MTTKKIEDLNVAKTNRVVGSQRNGGKEKNVQCSLCLTLILSA